MSPRSKQQFEELREASRDKIMEAALELFAHKGYDATSITEIARKAGVSKGLLYHYFESKESVLLQMIEELNTGQDKMMERVYSDDPSQFMRNLIEWFFTEMRENYAKWKLIMSLTMHIEQFEFVSQLGIQKFEGFKTLFTDLLERMGWKDPESEAYLLGAIFDGIGIQYYVLKENYPLDTFEKVLIDKYCTK